MTGPIKEFQRQILGREFAHGNNPLLTFAVDNLVVESDGKGNLCTKKPGNPNSPRKIDPAQASIMAQLDKSGNRQNQDTVSAAVSSAPPSR